MDRHAARGTATIDKKLSDIDIVSAIRRGQIRRGMAGLTLPFVFRRRRGKFRRMPGHYRQEQHSKKLLSVVLLRKKDGVD